MAGAILAAVMLGESPATPQTGSPIIAFHSGKVMDVFEASTEPFAPVVQWTPNGGTNQQWRLLHFSHVPPFELVIIQTLGSRQVLDVDGDSTDAGAELIQTPWAAEASQLWISYPFGNTGYRLLINVESQGLVADVAEASLANGAKVILWNWKGGLNQLWTVPGVTSPATTTTTGGGATTTTTAPATTTTTSGVKADPSLTGNADLFGQVGQPINDVATLSGGNNPTGTINFKVYTDDACATTPVFDQNTTVNGNGTYTSPPFTPTQEAAYIWVASYSGDANNNPAATACGDLNQVSLVVVE